MRKFKQSLLTIFFLYSIAGTIPNVFAEVTNQHQSHDDLHNQWLLLQNKKSDLEQQAKTLKRNYPQYEQHILGIMNHINELNYNGFIQPIIDLPKSEQRVHKQQKIEQMDEMIQNMRTLNTALKESNHLPAQIKEFFLSSTQLLEETCSMAKREFDFYRLHTQTASDNKTINTEERIALVLTPDEEQALERSLLFIKRIRENTKGTTPPLVQSALQTILNVFENYIIDIKRQRNEMYTLSELREIFNELDISENNLARDIEVIQLPIPELKENAKAILSTCKMIKKAVERCIIDLERKRMSRMLEHLDL